MESLAAIDVESALARVGHAYVQQPAMRELLGAEHLSDFAAFAASWDRLGEDRFMADGGRYRKRRFAAFAVDAAGVERKPHQPHYQSRDYNPLNGGVERWFEPITDAAAEHSALQAILRYGFQLFDALTPAAVRPPQWHVEVHQFRIETSAEQHGQPTPEGMHRDGVDWVLVMLIKRHNVVRGETILSDLSQQPIGSFTLEQPLDSALVDDSRVFHGVTPIAPIDASQPAYRDVLVVTYRRP